MKKNYKKRKSISEINVTPFVDVMLVLLIIFMVTAPLLTAGIKVNLPESTSILKNEKSDPVTVTINSSGIYIDNAMVTVADIVADNGVVHVLDAVLLPSSTGVTDINELNSNKYLYSINLLGKKVNRNVKKQVVLDIYSNGKVVKRFNP